MDEHSPLRPALTRAITAGLLFGCLGLAGRLAAAQSKSVTFAAGWDGRALRLTWTGLNVTKIRRSTDSPEEQDAKSCPVTVCCPSGSQWVDEHAASGVTYYYTLVADGQSHYTAVTIPPQALRSSPRPDIMVDKRNYVLEVWDGEQMLKRYPIAMGSNPMKRKLHQDRASTPEGRYHITQTQPNASFYKAYDINYPNAADKARYQLLRPKASIGGEIEIHGQGIDSNWTWGCMALRNDDMDELFDHPEIGVGTLVWIYGGEVSRADLESDEAEHPWSALELGHKQRAAGLKVTCLWDVATSRFFGR